VDYLDFEVEIGPGTGGHQTVTVLRSPAGEATESIRFALDSLALENRLQALQIALLRSAGSWRRIDSAEARAVQRLGQELWSSLFAGDILGRLEASRTIARQNEKGLRVKLRISSPELAALPWEYLYDANHADYLTLSTATPLVRYIALPQAMEPLAVRLPLRILALAVTSDDLPGLDVERERARLERAIEPLRDRGVVELVWLEGRTWRDLQRALRRESWHIFHFVGHGGFDPVHGEGLIVLADEQGNAHRLSATDLGRLLGDHEPLRLAVLNSCDSARADRLDVFSSTAATLVRRGTPAVVAMQYEITDDAAIEFSRSFYEALADGMAVDAALAEARKGVALAIPNTLEWGTPVLYMRAPDGVLFKLSGRQPRVAPVARATHAPLAPVDRGLPTSATPEPILPSQSAPPADVLPLPPAAAAAATAATVGPEVRTTGDSPGRIAGTTLGGGGPGGAKGITWTPPLDPGRVLARGAGRGFLGGFLTLLLAGPILLLQTVDDPDTTEKALRFAGNSWLVALLVAAVVAAAEYAIAPLRTPGGRLYRAIVSAAEGAVVSAIVMPLIVGVFGFDYFLDPWTLGAPALVFGVGAIGFVVADTLVGSRFRP
jgi:CHAT domain